MQDFLRIAQKQGRIRMDAPLCRERKSAPSAQANASQKRCSTAASWARVAVACGATLAAVNFVKMLLVDRMLLGNSEVTVPVAATVSVTLIFVVMFAKAVGSTLPMAAEKIGIDPAVMASPLISTITDAVSLLIYFTLATLLLHI